MKKFIKRIAIFYGFLFIALFMSVFIFPANSDGLIEIPMGYILFCIVLSIAVSFVLTKDKSKKHVYQRVSSRQTNEIVTSPLNRKLIISVLGVLLLCIMLFYAIAYILFPVNEVGYIELPEAYFFVWVCGTIGITFLFAKHASANNKKSEKECIAMDSISKPNPQPERPSSAIVHASHSTSIHSYASFSDCSNSKVLHKESPTESPLDSVPMPPQSTAEIFAPQQEEHRPYVALPQKKAHRQAGITTEYIDLILREEEVWRSQQRSLLSADFDLSSADRMDSLRFIHWCADLLKRHSFQNVQVLRGKDKRGVDILAQESNIKYTIHCKRSNSDVGTSAIWEIKEGMSRYNDHIGLIITNQHFTKDAVDMAEAESLHLWDRDKLSELLLNL